MVRAIMFACGCSNGISQLEASVSDPKSWASDSVALKTYTEVVWPLVQRIKKQQQARTPNSSALLLEAFGYASHAFTHAQNGSDIETNCDPKFLEVRGYIFFCELGRKFG